MYYRNDVFTRIKNHPNNHMLCVFIEYLKSGNDEKDLYRKITKTKLSIPNFVDGGARGLIARCLSYAPEERPTAVNVYILFVI